MRSLMIFAVLALCVQPAMAQEDALDEIRSQMGNVERDLRALEIKRLRELQASSVESIMKELGNLDQRSFELELELARINAHRSVLLSRVEQEKELIKVEKERLSKRLEIEDKRRAAMVKLLVRVQQNVDAGVNIPPELTQIRMQLMEMEERAALLKLEPLRKEVQLVMILEDVEIESATNEALRKELKKREEQIQARFDRAIELKEARAALEQEYRKLQGQLQRAEAERRNRD